MRLLKGKSKKVCGSRWEAKMQDEFPVWDTVNLTPERLWGFCKILDVVRENPDEAEVYKRLVRTGKHILSRAEEIRQGRDRRQRFLPEEVEPFLKLIQFATEVDVRENPDDFKDYPMELLASGLDCILGPDGEASRSELMRHRERIQDHLGNVMARTPARRRKCERVVKRLQAHKITIDRRLGL
jgi:hypothetical protein